MKQSSSKYLAGVDIAKGIAILGVMIAHADDRDVYAGILPSWQFAFGWCVTVFFGLAGYLEGKSSKKDGFTPYVRHRVRRLLIPYVALYFLYNFAFLVVTRLGVLAPTTLNEQSTIELLVQPHAPQLYFLPWLLVIGITLWWPLRRAPVVVAILLATVAGTWHQLAPPQNYGYGAHWENIPVYLAAFAVGYCHASGQARWPMLVLLVGCLAEVVRGNTYHSFHPVVAPLLLMVSDRAPNILTAFPGFLGRWSFAIFLWHVPFLMPVMNHIFTLWLPGSTRLLVVIATTSLVCIAWGSLLSRSYTLKRFAL